jgi:Tol biopolymer transport system component
MVAGRLVDRVRSGVPARKRVHVVAPDGTGDRIIGAGMWTQSRPTWSPDGRRVVVARGLDSSEGGGSALTVLDLAGAAPRDLLRGNFYARDPVWAPDGSLIAFAVFEPTAQNAGGGWEVQTVRPDGGAARRIASGERPVWSPEGGRIAVVDAISLTLVDPAGERSAIVAEDVDGYPTWSPDGRHLAFVKERGVYVVGTDGGTPRRVTREAAGTEVREPAWSPDGSRILYQAVREKNDLDLYILPPTGGRVHPITQNDVDDVDPAWSPDGATLAFVRALRPDSYLGGIFVTDAAGGTARPLTLATGTDSSPSWSPDASRIVFARASRTASSLYVIRSDGSHARRLGAGADPAWSPDGRSIAFAAAEGGIWRMRSDGSRRRPLVDPFQVAVALGLDDPDLVDWLWAPAWSPDGRTLAFIAYYARGPRMDYLAAFTVRSDGRGPVRVRMREAEPFELTIDWSPDGRSLVFGAGRVLVQPVGGGRRVDRTRNLPGTSIGASWQPRCTTTGSARSDSLRGSSGADVICGRGGDDRIDGERGADRIFGGQGNDVIRTRDRAYDIVGCGAGMDVVTADATDLVGVDCEAVQRANRRTVGHYASEAFETALVRSAPYRGTDVDARVVAGPFHSGR